MKIHEIFVAGGALKTAQNAVREPIAVALEVYRERQAGDEL